jgi:hypothetical protein
VVLGPTTAPSKDRCRHAVPRTANSWKRTFAQYAGGPEREHYAKREVLAGGVTTLIMLAYRSAGYEAGTGDVLGTTAKP